MKKEIYSGIVFAFLSASVLGSEEMTLDRESKDAQGEVRPPDQISVPKSDVSDFGTPLSPCVPTPIYLPPSGRDTFVGPTARIGLPNGMTGFTEPPAPAAPPPVDVKKCCGWW